MEKEFRIGNIFHSLEKMSISDKNLWFIGKDKWLNIHSFVHMSMHIAIYSIPLLILNFI